MMTQVTLIISGRVQMVKFRLFAQKEAGKRGIIGDVCNQPDGTVLIHAWAQRREGLQEFIHTMKRGSFLSRVDNVEQIWDNKTYEFPEKIFRIIR